MISSAEFIIYANDDDDTLSFALTPTQLKAVIKILGLEFQNNEMLMFSDESVNKIMSKVYKLK